MTAIGQRFGRTALLALALCSASVDTTQAQGLFDPSAAFIAMGIADVATGELNEHLAPRGYPTFNRTAATPSLGVYWLLPSGVMFGGEWSGLAWGKEPLPRPAVGLGGGYVTLGVGYAVGISRRARVYPRLGLGVGGMGLSIEGVGERVDFDDVLDDPDLQSEFDTYAVLGRASMLADLGAGAELLTGRRGRGLLIGVRAGYLATGFSGEWQTLEGPANGGPDASIAGPYARVMVGWRWRR